MQKIPEYLFPGMSEDVKKEAQNKEFVENSYYITISALQKCIRRGLTKESLTWAKVGLVLSPQRLFQRFHTILFEECALDFDLLKKFHETKCVAGDHQTILKFVALMCDARKADNSTCALSLMIVGDIPPNKETCAWLIKQGLGDVVEIQRDWDSFKYQLYDKRLPLELRWLIDVCERSSSFDREKLAACIPILARTFGIKMISEAPLIDECPETHMIDGWLPSCAMDGHTRPGMLAQRILFSRVQRVLPDKFDKNIVFYYEGGRRNKKIDLLTTFKDVYCQQYSGVSLNTPQIQDFYTKFIKSEMDDVRTWVVHSKMKESFEFLKSKYDEVNVI